MFFGGILNLEELDWEIGGQLVDGGWVGEY